MSRLCLTALHEVLDLLSLMEALHETNASSREGRTASRCS